MRYDRGRQSLDRHATYTSLPSSPAHHADNPVPAFGCPAPGIERRTTADTSIHNEPSIGRFLTRTDESANRVPSQVAPSSAARADDYLKGEEAE